MKKCTADFLAAAFFGLVLPSLMVQAAAVLLPEPPAVIAETTAATQPPGNPGPAACTGAKYRRTGAYPGFGHLPDRGGAGGDAGGF